MKIEFSENMKTNYSVSDFGLNKTYLDIFINPPEDD